MSDWRSQLCTHDREPRSVSCAALGAQLPETRGKGRAGRPRQLPGGGSAERGCEGQRGGSGWEWGSRCIPACLELDRPMDVIRVGGEGLLFEPWDLGCLGLVGSGRRPWGLPLSRAVLSLVQVSHSLSLRPVPSRVLFQEEVCFLPPSSWGTCTDPARNPQPKSVENG